MTADIFAEYIRNANGNCRATGDTFGGIDRDSLNTLDVYMHQRSGSPLVPPMAFGAYLSIDAILTYSQVEPYQQVSVKLAS